MRSNTVIRGILLLGILAWILTEPSHVPILTLIAIVIHEDGHILAARLCHVRTGSFSLDRLGARLALVGEMPSYGKEILICAAGPFAGLFSLLPLLPLRGNADADFFFSVSVALSLLNLLPIKGFDGGRICYCLCALIGTPKTAENITLLASFFCLFCLWSVSVYLMLRLGADISLFLFSISIFSRVFLLGKMP